MGRTAWHDAVEKNNNKVLDVLWEWGKEELTTEELSNKLLLAKDDKQNKNAWHSAGIMGNTESLEKICKWAEVNLTPEELKNKFILVKEDRKGLRGIWQQSRAKRSP
jgi:endo-1,4-beta-D-glucanase Y